MSSETIKIQIDFEETQNKYKSITDDKDFYSSPEYWIAYHSYRKSKGNAAQDLLTDLATSAVTSGFNAIRHTFSKAYDKAALKAIDEAVKDAVINSGGTWTD